MQIAKVKLGSNKVYSFSANGIEDLEDKDVIVETALGLSFGHVVGKITDMEVDNAEIKPVIRIATSEDTKKYLQLKAKAQKDISLVKEKVKKLGLEMKIVSCEYTFDASKIIIEFCAEERVDFRELLKELASTLRVRIELHQVGQRDEVKVKGGIGPCGEICCCVRFLKDFEHVTVKMAKTQGLSLSPTKISGLCGRLMCCLGYENETYEEVLKRMPKVNSTIDSPKGRGVVVNNDILRERVSVKISNGDESFTIYDFALEELGSNNVGDKKDETIAKPQENANLESQENIEKQSQNNNNVASKKEPNKNEHKNINNKQKNKFQKKGNKNGIQNN